MGGAFEDVALQEVNAERRRMLVKKEQGEPAPKIARVAGVMVFKIDRFGPSEKEYYVRYSTEFAGAQK